MSKVIDGDSLKVIKPWRMPELDNFGDGVVSQKCALEPRPRAGTHSNSPRRGKREEAQVNLLTAEKIAEIQAQAYREGFNQGREEGHKAGLADMQSKAKQFETLMTGLARPFEQLDERVEQELLALVSTLTRVLVRREIHNDNSVILDVVREALGALPVAAREVKLCLHPEDAALVRDSLAHSEEDPSWRIVSDHELEQGDCRVMSDSSQIDATMETRLKTLIAVMLDGDAQEADS